MNKQISLTMPDSLFRAAEKRSREEGYRSVQEYVLQCVRDKFFLERLPEYERILKEMEAGKGTVVDVKDLPAYFERLRKASGKQGR